MAVGLGPLPVLHPVAGFELGIASAGIKRPGRKDVVVMRCAEGSSVAGVFTLNAFCAAPVILAKQRVQGPVRYLLTNTGNANAGTGEPGLVSAARTCAKLAQLTGVDASQVLPYSTGVIGEPLPVEKIEGALQAALDDLSVDNWAAAATGIMTTDTIPKAFSAKAVVGGKTVHVTGISKGAGMIRPNMATMLGYIATDAKVAREVLQNLLLDGALAANPWQEQPAAGDNGPSLTLPAKLLAGLHPAARLRLYVRAVRYLCRAAVGNAGEDSDSSGQLHGQARARTLLALDEALASGRGNTRFQLPGGLEAYLKGGSIVFSRCAAGR